MTQPKHAQLDLLLSISDGLSRGSDEMLRVSPTDAMHPPSCSLAIRDAVEELKWLRAEIEWLRALLPPTAHSGVRNGPGEGSWSVFATKVVEERDAARAEVEKQRAEIEQLRAGIQSLAESLRASLDAAIRQRDEARAEIERLRAALRWYADPRNHFPVERRSPGDPDPAVVFVEEPPIMLDGGRRARSALEGKP